MSYKVTITLIDEVNCHVGGLSLPIKKKLSEALSFPVKGAYMTVAYQMGDWDGKESFIDDRGFTFTYFIEKIIETIISFGVKEEQITIKDEREYDLLPDDIPTVDENFLVEETGKVLRDYQVRGINDVITQKKGVINFATNAGKILINVGICKALDPYCKTVSIVPSAHLVKQTKKEMEKTSLSVKAIDAKVKVDDREEAIKNHNHLIITKKLFLNCAQHFTDDQFALIYDEAHSMGSEMGDRLRFDIPHSIVRIGMTGSFPKDRSKAAFIYTRLGAGSLGEVRNDELIQRQFSAKPYITMIGTHDPHFNSQIDECDLEWDMEWKYLTTNEPRIKEINDYINSFDKKNTLVLCFPEVAKKIATMNGEDYITQDTKLEDRISYFEKFDQEEGYRLFGSFDTSGTGISVDNIERLVLIDVGKNETWIKQGIGRGLRTDGKLLHLEVIDIYSKTKYSRRHKKERVKVYKDEKFEFVDENNYITITQ